MGSGITACRLEEWAEEMGLLDDNQPGFRTGIGGTGGGRSEDSG